MHTNVLSKAGDTFILLDFCFSDVMLESVRKCSYKPSSAQLLDPWHIIYYMNVAETKRFMTFI